MADVSSTLAAWSSTTASNNPSGATTIGTGLDDNLREIQGVLVRGLSHKGSDIASVAGTMDIGAVEGLMHDITGALAITGLGTVRAGILKVLKFEGAATLTHNATSLILPGGANIVCADGDVGIFISEGSGNWRCLAFQRKNGAPAGDDYANGWAFIQKQTASNVATVDFTLPTGYTRFRLDIVGAVPASDGVLPTLRFSDDSGSTFEADSGDYKWQANTGNSSSIENDGGTDTALALSGSAVVGNASGEFFSASLLIDNAESASLPTSVVGDILMRNASGGIVMGVVGGHMATASTDEAVRFLFASGNVTSGVFVLFGLRTDQV